VDQQIQNGWKLGEDGQFHKDENVEFDSEEEQPPTPPPGQIPEFILNERFGEKELKDT